MTEDIPSVQELAFVLFMGSLRGTYLLQIPCPTHYRDHVDSPQSMLECAWNADR